VGVPLRQHRAELLLAHARVHLANGRIAEAAETLQRAIDQADGRTGPRPDVEAVLTRSEMRVARMAAAGLKNREIADELTVSVKAVEYHLANTYRKLSIRGRADLPRMFDWTTA
jgi:DNA-binding NarL/FixJ family response regulator